MTCECIPIYLRRYYFIHIYPSTSELQRFMSVARIILSRVNPPSHLHLSYLYTLPCTENRMQLNAAAHTHITLYNNIYIPAAASVEMDPAAYTYLPANIMFVRVCRRIAQTPSFCADNRLNIFFISYCAQLYLYNLRYVIYLYHIIIIIIYCYVSLIA